MRMLWSTVILCSYNNTSRLEVKWLRLPRVRTNRPRTDTISPRMSDWRRRLPSLSASNLRSRNQSQLRVCPSRCGMTSPLHFRFRSLCQDWLDIRCRLGGGRCPGQHQDSRWKPSLLLRCYYPATRLNSNAGSAGRQLSLAVHAVGYRKKRQLRSRSNWKPAPLETDRHFVVVVGGLGDGRQTPAATSCSGTPAADALYWVWSTIGRRTKHRFWDKDTARRKCQTRSFARHKNKHRRRTTSSVPCRTPAVSLHTNRREFMS